MFLPGTRAFPARDLGTSQQLAVPTTAVDETSILGPFHDRGFECQSLSVYPLEFWPGWRAMEYHDRHGHDVCSFDLPSTRK